MISRQHHFLSQLPRAFLTYPRSRAIINMSLSLIHTYTPPRPNMSNVVLLSDLDGTMLPARHLKVSDNNIRALRDLGDSGTTRVVVTGRNGQSTRAILGPDFPIDYLVFSSGAGVMEYSSGRLIEQHNIPAHTLSSCLSFLSHLPVSYFVHHVLPHNHVHHYHYNVSSSLSAGLHCSEGSDFTTRLERVPGTPLSLSSSLSLDGNTNKSNCPTTMHDHPLCEGASQLLVVVRPDAFLPVSLTVSVDVDVGVGVGLTSGHTYSIPADHIADTVVHDGMQWVRFTHPTHLASHFRHLLNTYTHNTHNTTTDTATVQPPLSVVHATSPIDHESVWLEVFPSHVDKGKAAHRLVTSVLNMSIRHTHDEHDSQVPVCVPVCIGNDFNDLPLLRYGLDHGHAFVVDNAPSQLKDIHGINVVKSCAEDGFHEAVTHIFDRYGVNKQ